MMKDINWPYPIGGENSRDDKHEIGQKFATLMENIKPDGTVRKGIALANVDPIPGITWTFLYDDAVNQSVLIKSGEDLLSLTGNSVVTIKSKLFSSDDTVSAERIGDSVVLVTQFSGCHIVRKLNGFFQVESAVMQRAGNEAIIDRRFEDISAIAAIDESYHTYTFTWIRKDQNQYSTGGFEECIIESQDDPSIRYVAYSKGPGSQIGIRFDAPPSGATHVRIYRTIGTKGTIQNWDVIEQGMEFLWLADVPVGEAVYEPASEAYGDAGMWIKYHDKQTDGAMAGETNKLWMIGKNSIPTGRHVKYHNNRLWVGGKDGYNPGRWYYSEPIRSDVPLKWLLTFDYAVNFIDTSTDNTEYSMGCAVSRGDLIFFMNKNIWRLPAGDPQNYAPVPIGIGLGTLYTNSICENNQNAYYLSLRGPAVVGGSEVELAKEFSINNLWPNSFDDENTRNVYEVGRFPNAKFREKIFGFWYDDNWVIAGDTVTSCLMAPAGEVMGAWRINTHLNLVRYQPMGKGLCLAWDAEGRTYKWLHDSTHKDYLTNFEIKVQLSPKYLTSDYRMGTPYFAAINARWMDTGTLRTVLYMDSGRMSGSYRYEEVRNSTPVYGHSMPAYRQGWEKQRMVVQQSFKEGTIGTWIQPSIHKIFYKKFEFKGLTMRMRIMDGIMREYVGISEEEDLPPLDADIAVFDLQG